MRLLEITVEMRKSYTIGWRGNQALFSRTALAKRGRGPIPGHVRAPDQANQSVTFSLISSELPLSSGAYIAEAWAGNAENLPGISARMR